MAYYHLIYDKLIEKNVCTTVCNCLLVLCIFMRIDFFFLSLTIVCNCLLVLCIFIQIFSLSLSFSLSLTHKHA